MIINYNNNCKNRIEYEMHGITAHFLTISIFMLVQLVKLRLDEAEFWKILFLLYSFQMPIDQVVDFSVIFGTLLACAFNRL